MSLLEKFKQFIQKENLFQSSDMLLLAVSGGIDSVVLCELCKQSGYDFEIAHCNFQLRGDDSLRDEKFVSFLAQKYGVPFYVKTFDTIAYAVAEKKSIEEAARDLRYEWFYSLIEEKNAMGSEKLMRYIVTAHHADDNIETVVMNFFRGTGITGLKGIRPKQGKIIRPLLFARRSELEVFLQSNNLDHVTDHTNLENDYTRNFFRNTVLPLVSKTYPGAAGNVLNNIERFREAEVLYQQSVQLHLKKLLEPKGEEVHIPVLKLLKTVPLATIVFEIIKDFGFNAHQTGEVVTLLNSSTGKYIESVTHRIIKNRNWLIISPKKETESGHILIEEKDSKIIFKNGIISITMGSKESFTIAHDPGIACLDMAALQFPLLMRKWKQGDYFYPLGMQKKKKLSRFFIDQKLSLIQKENTWVIEMDKKIIWIVGLRIDDRFKIRNTTVQVYSLRLTNASGN